MSELTPAHNDASPAVASKRGRGAGRGRGRGRGRGGTNAFQRKPSPFVGSPSPSVQNYRLRSTPPYIQHKSASIKSFEFRPDPWDVSNQQTMSQAADQSNGDLQSLYEKLQAMRETERQEMENRGLVDRQEAKKKLEDAIHFVGSCMLMCPIFERVRRTYENNVKSFEKDPATGVVTSDFAVKAFSRPAAGQPPPLPSDVRPPHILTATLGYLVNNMLGHLPASHSFLWDRTRSIRQDFTYQNYSGKEAIQCNEIIARIHIVTLHIMAGADVEWSQQQELEQLHKTLRTLTEFYDDSRRRGISDCPCEPEIRAYQLLAHLNDGEVEAKTQKLPQEIFGHYLVQHALELRKLYQTQEFTAFFQTLRDSKTPVLFLCILEPAFNRIRLDGLRSMSRSYHSRGKPFNLDRLTSMFGFDDSAQTAEFCKYYDITVDEAGVDLNTLDEKNTADKPSRPQAYSQFINQKLPNIVEVVNQGSFDASVGFKPLSANNVFNSRIEPIQAPTAPRSLPTQPSFVKPPVAVAEIKPTIQPTAFAIAPPTQIQTTAGPAQPNNFQQTFTQAVPAAQPAPPTKPSPSVLEAAAESIVGQLLSNTVGQALSRIVPNEWNFITQQRRARNILLDEASSSIFNGMIGGFLDEAVQVAAAVDFDYQRLKIQTIRKIRKCGQNACAAQLHRQMKRMELIDVARDLGADRQLFQIGPVKHVENEERQLEIIEQARSQTIELWDPLDFGGIVHDFSRSLLPNSDNNELTIAVFSSDWESSRSGQWLRVKLGLEWDGNPLHTYQHRLTPCILMTALQTNAKTFDNIGILIIEVGVHGKEFDKNALSEIRNAVVAASRYQISVIFVDFGMEPTVVSDGRRKCTPYTFSETFAILAQRFELSLSPSYKHQKIDEERIQEDDGEQASGDSLDKVGLSHSTPRRLLDELPIVPLPIDQTSKRTMSDIGLSPKSGTKKFATQRPAGLATPKQIAELRSLIAQVKANKV